MMVINSKPLWYIQIFVLFFSKNMMLQTRGESTTGPAGPRDTSSSFSPMPNVTGVPGPQSPHICPNLLMLLRDGSPCPATTPNKENETSHSMFELGQHFLGKLENEVKSRNATNGLMSYFAAAFSINSVHIVKEVLAEIPPRTLLPRPQEMDPVCYDELITSIEALVGVPENTSNGKVAYKSMQWALKVFDAYGKPGPGMLSGALQFTGYYDQCVETTADVAAGTQLGKHIVKENKHFPMRYCRAQYNLGYKHPEMLAVPKHVATDWWNSNATLPPLLVNWGVCVPESCNSKDIRTLLSVNNIDFIGTPVEDVVCFDEPRFEDDVSAIITVCVLCMFAVLVLVCTTIDVWLHNFYQEPYQRGTCVSRSNTGASVNGAKKDNMAHRLRRVGPEQVGSSIGQDTNVNELCNGHSMTESATDDAVRNYKGKEADARDRKAAANKKINNLGKLFVEAFSMYRNFGSLLRINKSPGTIECLMGMRFISMVWIILGHTYTYGAIIDERNQMFDNVDQLPELIASKAFHIIGSAHLAVDTFFVQSGFLATKLMMDSPNFKKNSASVCFWIYIIFQRLWRLTPIYMMVMMAGTNLYDHIVNGPLKAYKFEEFYECKTKWWAHLLYINNFYEPEKKCMTWSWYLAVDMQLFLLLPVFVIPISRNRKFGVVVICGGIAVSMMAAFIAKYYSPGAFIMMDNSFIDYWKNVYTMPWARASPFLVGSLLAVFLAKRGRTPLMSKTKALLVWIVVAAVAFFLIFIIHLQWKANSDHWSRELQALYEACVRPIWAVCIAWVIYACHSGLGGFANTILSWDAFAPLSRLCYCMYLLHPVVITFVLYSRRTTIYMDPAHLSIIYNFFGNLALTILFSVIFYTTIEAPMSTLEKMSRNALRISPRTEERRTRKENGHNGQEQDTNI